MSKSKLIIPIFILSILILQNQVLGSSWYFKGFMSDDFSGIGEATTVYAVSTFQMLGYNNMSGIHNNYTVTSSKSDVLEYINYLGNNFGFYVNAHGNADLFTMQNCNPNQYIYPSDISGYWHFVFLDCCSCLATDKFARAFQTVGYSNRSTLGWYENVTVGGAEEWWWNFSNVAGSTNIRSACLTAADRSTNYTPIRIYGDKTWTGIAL